MCAHEKCRRCGLASVNAHMPTVCSCALYLCVNKAVYSINGQTIKICERLMGKLTGTSWRSRCCPLDPQDNVCGEMSHEILTGIKLNTSHYTPPIQPSRSLSIWLYWQFSALSRVRLQTHWLMICCGMCGLKWIMNRENIFCSGDKNAFYCSFSRTHKYCIFQYHHRNSESTRVCL